MDSGKLGLLEPSVFIHYWTRAPGHVKSLRLHHVYAPWCFSKEKFQKLYKYIYNKLPAILVLVKIARLYREIQAEQFNYKKDVKRIVKDSKFPSKIYIYIYLNYSVCISRATRNWRNLAVPVFLTIPQKFWYLS